MDNVVDVNSQTTENRYQAFIRATPDMLHLICRDGKFIDSHPGHIPPILPPAEYIGKSVYDVFPRPFADSVMEHINKALRTGEVQNWEYSLPQLPGQIFDCRFSRSGDAEVLVIIRDVTESKERQQALELTVQERTRQLEDSHQALQLFVYAASHDLQEPLAKITAFGKRLYDSSFVLDEKSREYVSIMVSASERLRHLIEDLLSYSQMGRKDQIPLCQININKILAEVLFDLSESIEKAGAKINTSPNLPIVMGHPMRIRQVFQNLISNAVKFRKPNQSPIIDINGYNLDQSVVFTVKDNGIGFDPEFKEKIFATFTRLHSRFEYPGTGLGLALCRKIMSHYNGTITAEGYPNEGAVFTLIFPEITNG